MTNEKKRKVLEIRLLFAMDEEGEKPPFSVIELLMLSTRIREANGTGRIDTRMTEKIVCIPTTTARREEENGRFRI